MSTAHGHRDTTDFVQGRRRIDRSVSFRAPAKLNLHLEVLRRRHDGYHEIETVLQAVTLHDTGQVKLHEAWLGGEPRIDLRVVGNPGVPADASNLCARAARLFCSKQRVSGHLDIRLEKVIPTEAGLGGGSSDAAAVLAACDHLFETGLDPVDLEALGAEVGSDVPFFVRGGTALGRGTGTRLTPLPRLGACQFLIVKPALNLKTQDVYERLKMGLTVQSAKANIAVVKSLLARFPDRAWAGFNRLEDVVLPAEPAVQRLVFRLRELAPVAMLTGSGSAVFGAFGATRNLAEVAGEFEAAGLYVRVVGPQSHGIELIAD